MARPSRRREFCHVDDTPCSSLLKHLVKVQGGGAVELQSRRRLAQPADGSRAGGAAAAAGSAWVPGCRCTVLEPLTRLSFC